MLRTWRSSRAYLTKELERQRFLAEFLQRLRETLMLSALTNCVEIGLAHAAPVDGDLAKQRRRQSKDQPAFVEKRAPAFTGS